MKALKEWSSIICALESGEQTVLLRKGGIQDAASGFREEQGVFFLFPTYEHQYAKYLKESAAKYATSNMPLDGMVCITSVAKVQSGADINAETADKLSEFHIWSDSYIQERQKWMPQKPLRAIFLSVSMIKPIQIPIIDEYSGCKSWLDINSSPENYTPVMDSDKLSAKLEKFKGIIS